MTSAPRTVSLTSTGPDVWLRECSYIGGTQQPYHVHDVTSVTLHLTGGIREWARRGDVESTGLSVSIKPAGLAHADRYGPDPVTTLQLSFAPSFDTGVGRWQPALERWRWLQGPPVWSAIRLWQLLRAGAADEAIGEHVVGVLDTLPRRVTSDRAPPEWLRRALQQIHDRRGSGVRVDELARDAGVHPVHLTRMFRRHVGCTVTGYLRRVRVAHAAGLLARSTASASAIASEAGFADQSHLIRTFKKETTLTPLIFRRFVG